MEFNDKSMKNEERLEWEKWARRLSEEKYENDEAAQEKELEIRTNKAIEKGIKEAMEKIALNMINEGGWTDEKISEITKMPVDEVKELRGSQ